MIGSTFHNPTNPMKSIRILFACVLAAFASVALVRAEGEAKSEKKCDAVCCTKEKKADQKGCCCAEACAKSEKKEDKK
jgi:hypothetical protein